MPRVKLLSERRYVGKSKITNKERKRGIGRRKKLGRPRDYKRLAFMRAPPWIKRRYLTKSRKRYARGITESNKRYEKLWNVETNDAIRMVNEVYNDSEAYEEGWECRYRRYFKI